MATDDADSIRSGSKAFRIDIIIPRFGQHITGPQENSMACGKRSSGAEASILLRGD
jgi:hypothetical protein